jgi:hypothetical protein
MNLFLQKFSPIIVTLPIFLFHQNSICDLVHICVKCTMLQGFGKMSYTHWLLGPMLCKPPTFLQVGMIMLDVFSSTSNTKYFLVSHSNKMSIESICELYDLEFELLYCDGESTFLHIKNICNNNDVLFP